MFDRKKYKRLAKRQLKGRYLTAILAIAISGLILALLNASTVSEYLNEDYDYLPNFAQEISYLNPIDYNFNFSKEYEKTDFIPLFLTLAIYGILTLSLCHLFNAYYKTTEKISFAEYLRGFSLWFKGILAMFWFSLWVFLWSLLFFIPGIVKGFSYSQMFFILAENPRIGVLKAMRLSKVMTKGYKADLFVMCLSFLGWEILSACTILILQLWIKPYEIMSFTNAYKDMKIQAIKMGVLTPEDFTR